MKHRDEKDWGVLPDIDSRRTVNYKESFIQVIYNRAPVFRPKKKRIEYRIGRGYTFLQDMIVVMRWACVSFDLKRDQLEMLLYLHPIRIFTRKQFAKLCDKQLFPGYFRFYSRNGWITGYYPDGFPKDGPEFYVLTRKANTLIQRIYRILLHEEAMPKSVRRNKLKGNTRNEKFLKMFMDNVERRKEYDKGWQGPENDSFKAFLEKHG